MSKYLVFSDLHLHNWGDFSQSDSITGNSRLTNQINALDDIMSTARSEGRIVLFLGDLFHQRGRVATNVFNHAMDVLGRYSDVSIIAIEGNHDNVSNSINSISSLEPFTVLPNFKLIEKYQKITIDNGDTIVGISYGEEYEELKKFIRENSATILMAHLGVEGALGAGKSKLDGAFTVGDLMSDTNYSLTLLGHYHKQQYFLNNSLYVGNPVAQDFGDEGDKGYFKFDTINNRVDIDTLEFVPLNYPHFIKITSDNIGDFDNIEELSENNFIRVVLPESTIKETTLKEDSLPDNVRLEKQIVSKDADSRIDISDDTDTVSIVKKWGSVYQPDNIDILVKQIQKVI